MAINSSMKTITLEQEIAYLQENNFVFDEPVPLVGKLEMYPVTVRDYNDFMRSVECCTLKKNDDPEGVIMTHLGYLFSKLENKEEGAHFSMRLLRLIELVFHVKQGVRCKNCGKIYSYPDFLGKIQKEKEDACCDDCKGVDFEESIQFGRNEKNKPQIVVEGEVILSKDFDRMRQIIMHQNFLDYHDDSMVSKELRDDKELYERLTRQKNGEVSATLEKKMVCLAAKTSYRLPEIYDLTIRKFSMLLQTVDDALGYEADRIAVSTGLVSGGELEHWIYKKSKTKYNVMDAGTYTGKIKSANG